jgi:hypothetical protein
VPVSISLLSLSDFEMVVDIYFPLSCDVGVVQGALSSKQVQDLSKCSAGMIP